LWFTQESVNRLELSIAGGVKKHRYKKMIGKQSVTAAVGKADPFDEQDWLESGS
jgi:hypothetical protein